MDNANSVQLLASVWITNVFVWNNRLLISTESNVPSSREQMTHLFFAIAATQFSCDVTDRRLVICCYASTNLDKFQQVRGSRIGGELAVHGARSGSVTWYTALHRRSCTKGSDATCNRQSVTTGLASWKYRFFFGPSVSFSLLTKL